MIVIRIIAALLLVAFGTRDSFAACVNRFIARSERPRQIVTLLTGKLTFQEATTLAAAVNSRKAPVLEWVAADGTRLAKQMGELKIVRPMPVGCDGKASGAIMIVTFAPMAAPPQKRMFVKFDANTTVMFEQQTQ